MTPSALFRLIAAVLLPALVLTAAPPPTGRPLTGPEVEELLRLYGSIATLKTTFVQTKLVKDIDVRLKSEGTLTLTRPDKVTWLVVKPARLEFSVEGKRVTLVSGSGKDKKTESWSLEANLDRETAKSLVGILAWLRLDVPAIRASYELVREGDGLYRCTPLAGKPAPFQALQLRVHRDGHVERLALDELSGDRIEIDFGRPQLTRK